MENKNKIINDFGVNINLNFKAFNGKITNIPPKSYAFITDDELLYLSHSSSILSDGLIRVEGKGAEENEIPDEVKSVIREENIFDEKRYNDLLKKTNAQLSKELKDITNIDALKELLRLANDAEKQKSYTDLLEKRIEELAE